jgi:aryl-alcohol dehydrogenase-like predicted oxidoreductase
LEHPGSRSRPLVLGGSVFGWTWTGRRCRAGCVLDEGFSAVDTADVYSRWAPGHQGGESETVIGEWMAARGNRSKVTLITKVGSEMPAGKGLKAAYIQSACEASLKRLGTDHIDLYFSHFPDEKHVGSWARMSADQAGKVRAVRASNYDAAGLLRRWRRRGGTHARYSFLQPRTTFWCATSMRASWSSCASARLGVIPTSRWRASRKVSHQADLKIRAGWTHERG